MFAKLEFLTEECSIVRKYNYDFNITVFEYFRSVLCLYTTQDVQVQVRETVLTCRAVPKELKWKLNYFLH